MAEGGRAEAHLRHLAPRARRRSNPALAAAAAKAARPYNKARRATTLPIFSRVAPTSLAAAPHRVGNAPKPPHANRNVATLCRINKRLRSRAGAASPAVAVHVTSLARRRRRRRNPGQRHGACRWIAAARNDAGSATCRRGRPFKWRHCEAASPTKQSRRVPPHLLPLSRKERIDRLDGRGASAYVSMIRRGTPS